MNTPDEITECKHRPACDGCPLFEAGSGGVAIKTEALRGYFRSYRDRFGWRAPQVESHSADLGYRNRARMVVEGARLGFYQAGSRNFIEIERCLVHTPHLEGVLDHIRDFEGLSECRFVDVRSSRETQSALVSLVRADEPADAWIDQAIEHFAGVPGLSLALELLADSDAIGTGVSRVLHGDDSLSMRVSGFDFEVTNDAFFQVNIDVLEAIHRRIRPFLESVEDLVDAYCGVGVHGIAVSPENARIRGFDAVPQAVELAQRNADRAGREATYLASSDSDFMLDGETSDALIVNPARSGLSQPFVKRISGHPFERIVYVSCDPPSFLRDAERLVTAGWRPVEWAAFDMMPRTEHVELLGLFERIEEASYSIIDTYSGVEGPPADDTWFAIVEGELPRRATLPRAMGTITRLRRCGPDSVVEIQTQGIEVDALRETLRAWQHPIVGDRHFGHESTAHRYEREFALDRPALHRYRSGDRYEVVSAHLVSMFKLPAKVLNPLGRGDDV